MDEGSLYTVGDVSDQPLLPVRRLHNYFYCPRLFYYQWVENIFLDNHDTVEGSHVHRNVDNPSKVNEELPKTLPEGSRLRSLKLESVALGMVGVVDLAEGTDNGIRLVDYKKGSARRGPGGERLPKEADVMQVAAHALLLHDNDMPVADASIYYAEDKRHVPVSITSELLDMCRVAIGKAKELAISGRCPDSLQDDPRCLYCSAYPVCHPNESAWWADDEAQIRPVATPPRPENDEGEILVVQTPGAQIGIRGGNMVVSVKGEKVQSLPFHQVRSVYAYGAVQITASAVQQCLESGVDVSYFAPSGRFLGLLRGLPASGIDARIAQYRMHDNLVQRMPVARKIIRAKITNQRVMLMRNGVADSAVLAEMADLRDATNTAPDIPSLMGTEGRAAALYFQHFRTMLRQEIGFDFTCRNRRPPRDPVNALLSMAYSVLCKELAGICHTVGLDPFVGFLHAPRYGRPAMALDLMEEFRPLVADSVAISMINRREVNTSDFIHSANGVFLNENGRRSFWEAYARRMNTEVSHPVFQYSMSYRRMMEVQARQVWRYLRGEAETYHGFVTK